MENQNTIDEVLDLGTWLGRKQAFGLIAGKCSAADAECLRKVRDGKGYLALGMNWEEFCKQKVGISRQTAERVIRNLEEFGPQYFELAAVVRIAPEQYRLIAGAVTEAGVECQGQTIEISAQNTPRLAQAVEALRQSAATPAAAPPEAEDAARAQKRARKSFQDAMENYIRAWRLSPDPRDREKLLREMDENGSLMLRGPI